MHYEIYPIENICSLVKGTYSSTKTEPGDFPLVVTAEQRRSADTYQLEGPAVCIPLISSTGHGDAALHRVHYQEGYFALADLLVALIPKDTTICNAKYLFHLFMAKKEEYFIPLMSGTANVSLKMQDIAKVNVPLPPLKEQHRIVARIEELAAKIEEARGLQKEAIEDASKLTEELEFLLWPDKDLSGAPLLEDVTGFLARGRQSEQGISDHYLIKTQHVQLGKYIRSHMTLAPEIAERVQPEALARKKDILIACSAAGCLGRVAYFMEDQLASTDTHIAIARANPKIILPEYLYAYLKSSQGQLQLRSRERGDWTREKVGFRLTELNLADLKRVPVPLPSISEQKKILERLDDFESKLNAIKHHQTSTTLELDALLPSILNKAFKGEL